MARVAIASPLGRKKKSNPAKPPISTPFCTASMTVPLIRRPMSSSVILVTGGGGLVGQAIKYIIDTEPEGSKFGKRSGETWIFSTSGEGDLRYAEGTTPLARRYINERRRASRDPKATEALFDKHKPTLVIHLAALGTSINSASLHPLTLSISWRSLQEPKA